jgi:serine/threonine-protein phosphatase CPPED1
MAEFVQRTMVLERQKVILRSKDNISPLSPGITDMPQEIETNKGSGFTFVIGADTQLGMGSGCRSWEYEMEYSLKAIQFINILSPPPAFVCLCGDLIDMEPSLFQNKSHFSHEECLQIQSQQFADFRQLWNQLNSSIPLLCLCGNHDVGNVPTAASIQRYTQEFGDDYYAFWAPTGESGSGTGSGGSGGTYCICLNTNLYSDPSLSQGLYERQHQWLEDCLKYARACDAHQIFLFGHHPWFLLHEDETDDDLVGKNFVPNASKTGVSEGQQQQEREFVPDSYFHIPLCRRRGVMSLCQEYRVTACFAGHYHQNLLAQSSWGMPMIITAAICNFNLQSTAKDLTVPEHSVLQAGVRIVTVDDTTPEGFHHRYCPI